MTKEELKLILDKHSKWLRNEEGGERADLSGTNLSGTDLSGTNLRGTDLRGANLSRTNLRGADLSGTDLSGINFYRSNLSGVNLSGVNLNRTNLSGTNLSGAIHSFNRLKSITGFEYFIIIIDDIIQVGCQTYSYEKWKNFSQKEIYRMDRDSAVEFYPKLLKILEMEMV